jgi:hypothetical protein
MQKFSACKKRDWLIHLLRSTSSVCMIAIWPAGPPKEMKPSFSQNRNASAKLGAWTEVVFNRGRAFASCDQTIPLGTNCTNKASTLLPPNEFSSMKTSKLLIAAVVSSGLMFAATVQAHEEKEETVEMKSLPAVVQKTMKDKAAGGEIVRIEKETKKGKMVYEAVVKKNGKEWGIEVDQNGKYLSQHDESKEKGEKHEKH